MKRRKSPKRVDFEAEFDRMRPKVLVRSGGLCELQIPRQCLGAAPLRVVELDDGRRIAEAVNVHHRKDRQHGGTNDLWNLLHLCGSATTGCHGYVTQNPMVSDANGWTVPSWDDPSKVPVVSFRER